MTKKRDKIKVLGETCTTVIPFKEQPEYCHKCLSEMVIRCAWCGDPIFIGDAITLYSPTKKDYEFPSHAVFYDKEKKIVVGCLGWNCDRTGGDRAGFWFPPSKVHRVPTAWKTLCQNPDAKAIITSDLSDPRQKTSIFKDKEGAYGSDKKQKMAAFDRIIKNFLKKG